jgi:hypothetical protein
MGFDRGKKTIIKVAELFTQPLMHRPRKGRTVIEKQNLF